MKIQKLYIKCNNLYRGSEIKMYVVNKIIFQLYNWMLYNLRNKLLTFIIFDYLHYICVEFGATINMRPVNWYNSPIEEGWTPNSLFKIIYKNFFFDFILQSFSFCCNVLICSSFCLKYKKKYSNLFIGSFESHFLNRYSSLL